MCVGLGSSIGVGLDEIRVGLCDRLDHWLYCETSVCSIGGVPAPACVDDIKEGLCKKKYDKQTTNSRIKKQT